MKKVLLIFFIIITCTYSQDKIKASKEFYSKGNFEFGFISNIGSSSEKTIENAIYTNNGTQKYKYEYNHEGIFSLIGISAGYYIVDGLSIEPELDLNLSFDGSSTSLLGNLCYTFFLHQKSIYPFAKIGFGLSNSVRGSSVGLFESLNYKTINAGVGLKFMYYSGLSFKLELNYRNLSGTDEFSSPFQSSDYEITFSVFSVSLGISLVL